MTSHITPLACEVLDWFSRRPRPVHRASVPPLFMPIVRRLLRLDPSLAVLERVDVVLVQITRRGRDIAAAYRIGRAALAPSQRELVA